MAEGQSLSQQLIRSAKKYTAKDIAAKEEAEYKKEGILGGLMALVKPLAGFASKGLLGLANITSGGFLSPLLMGLGTTGLTGLVDKFLRKSGMGADPSEITADSKYGFGEEDAKTISERLEKSIESRDPLSKEGFFSDVMMSYISALTPKIDPFTGETTGGELLENITPGGKGEFSWFGKSVPKDLSQYEFGKDIVTGYDIEENPFYSQKTNPAVVRDFSDVPMDWDREGGKVPEYRGGGTIIDYFSRQGKTLGGSNTQSLAEMLGKK
jgi:hypothetical protein